MFNKNDEKLIFEALGKREKVQECSSQLLDKTLSKVNIIEKSKNKGVFLLRLVYIFASLTIITLIHFSLFYTEVEPPAESSFYGADNSEYKLVDLIEINKITDYYNKNINIDNFEIYKITLYYYKDDEAPGFLKIDYMSEKTTEENSIIEDISIYIILKENSKFFIDNYFNFCNIPLEITDGNYFEQLNGNKVDSRACFYYENIKFYMMGKYYTADENASSGERTKEIIKQFITQP